MTSSTSILKLEHEASFVDFILFSNNDSPICSYGAYTFFYVVSCILIQDTIYLIPFIEMNTLYTVGTNVLLWGDKLISISENLQCTILSPCRSVVSIDIT